MEDKMHRRFFAPAIGAVVIAVVSLAIGAHAAPLTIGFSMPDLSESFWTSLAYGVDDEAKKLGVTVVKLNAGGDANVNQQISQLQDLAQRHVDAMIVGATSGDAIRPAVEQVIAANIPVVGIASLPNTPKLASAVSADHYAMGKLQAQCLGKAIDGSGEVGMMAGPAGQSWSDLRADGFRDTIKAEFPNVKIATESRLADNRNAALNTTEDWVQRFTDLKGIYSATDDIGAGVVDALKAANKFGQVKVSTSNFSPTAQKMLASGEFACTAIQQIVLQGRVALQQAVKAAKGEKTEPKIGTPALLVTKDNMSTINLSEVTAPAGYRP
jgi:ribose transport system substrate-binding protein/inositol transport system substrate-binding protein